MRSPVYRVGAMKLLVDTPRPLSASALRMRKMGWLQVLLGAFLIVVQVAYLVDFVTGAADENELVTHGGRARATITDVQWETRRLENDEHHGTRSLTFVSYRFEAAGQVTEAQHVEVGTACGNVRAGIELPIFYDVRNPHRNLLECNRPVVAVDAFAGAMSLLFALVGVVVLSLGFFKTRARRLVTHGVEAITVEGNAHREYEVAGRRYRATETGDAKDESMRLPDGNWLVLYDPRSPSVHVVVTNGMFEELRARDR